MSSLRNNKNIQSSVASGVFVGLRAAHSHVTELHVTKLHSDVENVSAGDALVYQNEKWQPAELSN